MKKVKLAVIVDSLEMTFEEMQVYLHKPTGETCCIRSDAYNDVEEGRDVSDQAPWYQEAVEEAKHFFENEDEYLCLPDKFDFHEYRVMEHFIAKLPDEMIRDEMFNLIRGQGAFSRFRRGLERFNLRDEWFAYRDRELEEFAGDWCMAIGVEFE